MQQGLHSQHFISFITYKWAQEARVPGKPFQLSMIYDSSLLDPFIIYSPCSLIISVIDAIPFLPEVVSTTS